VLPPGIEQVFLPATVSVGSATRTIADRIGGSVSATGQRLVFEPALLGLATVHFVDRRRNVDERRDYSLLLPLSERAALLSWKDAIHADLGPRDLDDRPAADALFVSQLPEVITRERDLRSVTKDFSDHLYRNESYALASNPALKLTAAPGESERDFKVRCQQVAREARDAEVDKLRDKYEVKLKRLEDRRSKEERELAEDKAEFQGRVGEEVLSGLSSVAGALGLFGRKSRSLSGLSTAARKRRMSSSAKADIAESEAEIARMQADIEELKGQMEEDANALTQKWAEVVDAIEEVKITPGRTDVDVRMVALAWAPNWEVTCEDARGRQRTDAVPAYPVQQA